MHASMNSNIVAKSDKQMSYWDILRNTPEIEKLLHRDDFIRREIDFILQKITEHLLGSAPFPVVMPHLANDIFRLRLHIVVWAGQENIPLATIMETTIDVLETYQEQSSLRLIRALQSAFEVMSLLADTHPPDNWAEHLATQHIPSYPYDELRESNAPSAMVRFLESSFGVEICFMSIFLLYERNIVAQITPHRMTELTDFARICAHEYKRYAKFLWNISIAPNTERQQEWQTFIKETAGIMAEAHLERPIEWQSGEISEGIA